MNRRYQARGNRRDPAKRINNDVWNRYQPVLRKLYKKKGMPLPEVMKKMEAQYNFKATTKQYRYRLGQVWGWMKYNHGNGNFQSPKTQMDSDSDSDDIRDLRERMLESDISRIEYDSRLTPSSSDDDGNEGKTNYYDISTLRKEFLSAFPDDVCYPVHESDFLSLPSIIAKIQEHYYKFPNIGHSEVKNTVVRELSQAIGSTNDSTNVVAYHRFNFALRYVLDKLGKSLGVDCSDKVGDTLPITELRVLEKQVWYRDFDENSPPSQCLQSCLNFCKECILSNQFGGGAVVPSPFNSLGNGEDEANTFRKDVCLFVYLWDAWASTHSESFVGTKSRWYRFAEHTLGITPTMVLYTMSSLILAVAADPPSQPTPLVTRQRRWSSQTQNNDDDGVLFDLAREGIRMIENWEKRNLVSEFIREFVWMQDPHDPQGGYGSGDNENAAKRFEKAARIAAQEYIMQWKLRTGLSVDDQENEDENASVDCMDVDIGKGDGVGGEDGVDNWGLGDSVDDDSSVISEEE
ncbi:Clr5 domain-containing protein [Biscogniauxia marginata]|nr:Clr5 domain-containing protein [Biscogniauxia marginata]